jgi:archaemetzincin
MPSEILLIPLGEVAAPLLAHLCEVLAMTFGCRCSIGEALPLPVSAFSARRNQYSARATLNRLDHREGTLTLGIVDVDLYVPELNFVFGLADPTIQRAVIALPRLRQEFYNLPKDERLFLARAAKEAIHELGHTAGLGHCNNRSCVMAFSNSLLDTDYEDIYALFEFARNLGYEEAQGGYLSKCHLCMDARRYLALKGGFEESTPREFYNHLAD